MTAPSKSALSVQEGGSHYKDLPIQPVEYSFYNGLNYLQGNVVKYVTRYKSKNGRQDLEKAKHYLDLLIELEYSDECPQAVPAKHCKQYCKAKPGEVIKV